MHGATIRFMVTTKFKSGGLHEKHLGTISAFVYVFCGNKKFQVTASTCSIFKEYGEGSKSTFYIDQIETAPVLLLERVTDICTVLAILFDVLTMDSVTL